MKKIFILLPLLFLNLIPNLNAQSIGAYEDYRNFFHVFHEGRFKQLESQKIREFKVARNHLVWINNVGQFKIFENGYEKVLRESPPDRYTISDNLMVYEIGGQVYVYENRRSRRIINYANSYQLGDSLLAFIDFNSGLNVFYKGRTRSLEVFDVSRLRVGKNILAYVDNMGQFYCYHAGEQWDLDHLVPESFKLGRNVVAYVDNYRRFQIYHNGNIVQADPYPPKSYAVGDNLVAWENRNGQLMVFDDGIISRLEDLSPVEYTVKDGIVAYKLSNQEFKAFYHGETYALESFFPEEFKIDNETLAWVDYRGNLRALYKGELVKPSNRLVKGFEVYLDVIQSDISTPRPQFFYKGKIY